MASTQQDLNDKVSWYSYYFLIIIFKKQQQSPRGVLLCKKGVLGNFIKFTGKHLCQSLFFNKVAALSRQFYLKKTLAQVFLCEFCEISKNTFSYRKPLGDCFCKRYYLRPSYCKQQFSRQNPKIILPKFSSTSSVN